MVTETQTNEKETATVDVNEKAKDEETQTQIQDLTEEQEDIRYTHFNDSTHQFMFTDQLMENGKVIRDLHICDKLLAFCLILLQIALYIYLITTTQKDIADDVVPVEITHGNCQESNGMVNGATASLQCNANKENPGPVITAIFVLICFVISDVASAFQMLGCCSSKCSSSCSGNIRMAFVAVLIIIEAILAIIAGTYFASLGNISSGVDAFLGCVGVVFIHDIDEKVRQFYSRLPSFKWFVGIAIILLVIGFLVLFLSFTCRLFIVAI